MLHFLTKLHLTSGSAIAILSLTFGLGTSMEVAGDGQVQAEEGRSAFGAASRSNSATASATA